MAEGAVRGGSRRNTELTRGARMFDMTLKHVTVAVALAIAFALGVVACSDGQDEPSATPVPLIVARSGGPPELASEVAPDGLELLAESDLAMRSLTGMSVVEEYRSTSPPGTFDVRRVTLVLVEPEQLRVVNVTENGTPLDKTLYNEGPFSPYEYFNRGAGYRAFSQAPPADVSDVRVIGEDEIDGEPAWVVWYQFRVVGFDSVYRVYRTEWISKESKLLLRHVELNTDPSSGTERESILSDFEF